MHSLVYIGDWRVGGYTCFTGPQFLSGAIQMGFKWSLTPDFELRFFSWISVPQAHKYYNGAVLNFFENSRRYSRINVYCRCKQHRRKAFQRCQRHRRKIYRRCRLQNILTKFISNFFIFFRQCHWHRWQTFIRDYLREFSKKFETIPIGYSEAGGDTDLWKKPEVENLVSDSR